MANETSLDIKIKATADTAEARTELAKVEKAVEKVTTAESEQSDSMSAARSSLQQKLEALKNATKAEGDHSVSIKDSTTKTDDFDTSVLKLPSGLRGLAGGLGAANLAVGVLKAGFDAWLEQNPQLQESLDRTTGQVGKLATGVLSEWFETWIMKAETGKSILDSVTVALGGETAAMEAARTPMAGYADEKEQAAINTQAFIEKLDEEASAAKRATDALKDELEQLKLRNDLDAAKGGLDANRKKREIDAGPGSKEDKDKAKAQVDAQAAVEQQQRDEAERNKASEAAAQQAKIAEDEAARLKQKTSAKEKQMRDASLRGGLVDQNKALNEQLKEAEAWTKGGGGVDKSAEVESLKKQIADNQRGIDTLKPGDVEALKKEAEELKKRAEAADKEAAKAAAAATDTRNKNDQLNEIGRVKTQDRVEQLVPPKTPGPYNPSPLDRDYNSLGPINKTPNRYDAIPMPTPGGQPPARSPLDNGGGGNPLGELGPFIEQATASVTGSPLESGIGELGGTLKDFAAAVTEQNAKLDAAIKAAAADARQALSQVKNAL